MEVVSAQNEVQHSVKMSEEVVPESKYEEVKEDLSKMKAKKDPLPGFSGYNLPPLSMKKGAFDNDILRL